MSETYDNIAQKIHSANKNWWVDLKTGGRLRRNRGEMLMLVVTELAEAVEGIRKNLMDDHLPHRKMEEVEMADAAIRLFDFAGGFRIPLDKWRQYISVGQCRLRGSNKAEQILKICREVAEVGDPSMISGYGLLFSIMLIQSYCRRHKLDLQGAMQEKLAYNARRADHKLAHRKKKHGKKF